MKAKLVSICAVLLFLIFPTVPLWSQVTTPGLSISGISFSVGLNTAASVTAGSSYTAYISGSNLTSQTYFDVQFLASLLGVSFTRSGIFQSGQMVFQNGVPQNVTASFQVVLPQGSPVTNITFGFGTPLGIAYIDLSGGLGSGSFSFQSVH